MQALHIEIVTPDSNVLSTEVDYVGAPGIDGQIGIMPGHIPLLSALQIGGLYYRKDGKTVWAFISGGFLEIAGNMVSVLAESAELADDIDTARAESAKKRALDYINCTECEGVDQLRAEKALKRADVRLEIALHSGIHGIRK